MLLPDVVHSVHLLYPDNVFIPEFVVVVLSITWYPLLLYLSSSLAFFFVARRGLLKRRRRTRETDMKNMEQ